MLKKGINAPGVNKYAETILELARNFNNFSKGIPVSSNLYNLIHYLGLIRPSLNSSEKDLVDNIVLELSINKIDQLPKQILDQITLIVTHYADPTSNTDAEPENPILTDNPRLENLVQELAEIDEKTSTYAQKKKELTKLYLSKPELQSLPEDEKQAFLVILEQIAEIYYFENEQANLKSEVRQFTSIELAKIMSDLMIKLDKTLELAQANINKLFSMCFRESKDTKKGETLLEFQNQIKLVRELQKKIDNLIWFTKKFSFDIEIEFSSESKNRYSQSAKIRDLLSLEEITQENIKLLLKSIHSFTEDGIKNYSTIIKLIAKKFCNSNAILSLLIYSTTTQCNILASFNHTYKLQLISFLESELKEFS